MLREKDMGKFSRARYEYGCKVIDGLEISDKFKASLKNCLLMSILDVKSHSGSTAAVRFGCILAMIPSQKREGINISKLEGDIFDVPIQVK